MSQSLCSCCCCWLMGLWVKERHLESESCVPALKRKLSIFMKAKEPIYLLIWSANKNNDHLFSCWLLHVKAAEHKLCSFLCHRYQIFYLDQIHRLGGETAPPLHSHMAHDAADNDNGGTCATWISWGFFNSMGHWFQTDSRHRKKHISSWCLSVLFVEMTTLAGRNLQLANISFIICWEQPAGMYCFQLTHFQTRNL